MDQELKQRLIGAVVVTALAAIFIPMLFDDPIDDSAQTVASLTIPQVPATTTEDTANKLPSSAAQVIGSPDTEAQPANSQPPNIEPVLPEQDSSAQDESIAEETIEPIDEQQWVEESRTEETSKLAEEEDSGDSQGVAPATSKNPDPVIAQKPDLKQDTIEPAPSTTPTKAKITGASPSKPVKPKATEAPTVKPTPKENPAPKPETVKTGAEFSRWYIQAGSFGKKANALSLWESLRKQGLPVVLETQNTAKGPLYRLKVGPELNKKRAIDIKNRLNKQNIKSLIIAE